MASTNALAIVPTVARIHTLNLAELVTLGDITPTRDLLFVKDTVNGFLKIAECNKLIGHEVNIATQSEITVGDLAQLLINQINPFLRKLYLFTPKNYLILKIYKMKTLN